MNEIERLQGEIAAMANRVKRLEVLFAARAAMNQDERAAAEVAAELGFSPEILYLPRTSADVRNGERARTAARRRALALALHGRGWSASRIARAMGCADRSAQRWLAVATNGAARLAGEGAQAVKGRA